MSRPMLQALKTPDLTAAERTIFAYLVGRANGARVCWERISNIQKDLGIKTRHTICDTTKKLVEMGRLHVKRRLRMENTYTILDPDGWLYDPPPAKTNGASHPVCEQKTAHQDAPVSVQETAHLDPVCEQETAHLEGEGRAVNRTADVQKTAQESFSKNLTIQERGACAPKALFDSGFEGKAGKQAKAADRGVGIDLKASLARLDLPADERVNLETWLRRQAKGDLSRRELTDRLAFIRMRYPRGYHWLFQHVDAVVEIAGEQDWYCADPVLAARSRATPQHGVTP